MSDQTADVKRGLAGVVADSSAISVVDEESGSLLYRGYPVPDLAASYSFEEVAYLIWYGELPSASQLSTLEAAERSRRELPADLSLALGTLSLDCHPMDVLRTAVSYLGAQDPTEDDASRSAELEKSLDLWAKLPTIVAAEQRRRNGQARSHRTRTFLSLRTFSTCARARSRTKTRCAVSRSRSFSTQSMVSTPRPSPPG